MLLRRLREVMAEPQSAQARLDKVVVQVAANMVAEVCSIYVSRRDGSLELFATDGTSSTHVPVLQEGGPTGFRMLTRPVIFTEKLPVLGDKGDIAFVDFSQYLIGLRLDANIQTSSCH